jgi:hypothetical protein
MSRRAEPRDGALIRAALKVIADLEARDVIPSPAPERAARHRVSGRRNSTAVRLMGAAESWGLT